MCVPYAGMHAWFGAFVDKRYSVVVPIIGVQVGDESVTNQCIC